MDRSPKKEKKDKKHKAGKDGNGSHAHASSGNSVLGDLTAALSAKEMHRFQALEDRLSIAAVVTLLLFIMVMVVAVGSSSSRSSCQPTMGSFAAVLPLSLPRVAASRSNLDLVSGVPAFETRFRETLRHAADNGERASVSFDLLDTADVNVLSRIGTRVLDKSIRALSSLWFVTRITRLAPSSAQVAPAPASPHGAKTKSGGKTGSATSVEEPIAVEDGSDVASLERVLQRGGVSEKLRTVEESHMLRVALVDDRTADDTLASFSASVDASPSAADTADQPHRLLVDAVVNPNCLISTHESTSNAKSSGDNAAAAPAGGLRALLCQRATAPPLVRRFASVGTAPSCANDVVRSPPVDVETSAVSREAWLTHVVYSRRRSAIATVGNASSSAASFTSLFDDGTGRIRGYGIRPSQLSRTGAFATPLRWRTVSVIDEPEEAMAAFALTSEKEKNAEGKSSAAPFGLDALAPLRKAIHRDLVDGAETSLVQVRSIRDVVEIVRFDVAETSLLGGGGGSGASSSAASADPVTVRVTLSLDQRSSLFAASGVGVVVADASADDGTGVGLQQQPLGKTTTNVLGVPRLLLTIAVRPQRVPVSASYSVRAERVASAITAQLVDVFDQLDWLVGSPSEDLAYFLDGQSLAAVTTNATDLDVDNRQASLGGRLLPPVGPARSAYFAAAGAAMTRSSLSPMP